jgi:hypothetical protein
MSAHDYINLNYHWWVLKANFNPLESLGTKEKARLVLSENRQSFTNFECKANSLEGKYETERLIQRSYASLSDTLLEISNSENAASVSVKKIQKVGRQFLLLDHFLHALMIEAEIGLGSVSSDYPWSHEHVLLPFRTHCDSLYAHREEKRYEPKMGINPFETPFVNLEKVFSRLSTSFNPLREFETLEWATGIYQRHANEFTRLNRCIKVLPDQCELVPLIKEVWKKTETLFRTQTPDAIRMAGKHYLFLDRLVQALLIQTKTPSSKVSECLDQSHPLYGLGSYFENAFPFQMEEESESEDEAVLNEAIRLSLGLSLEGEAAAASESGSKKRCREDEDLELAIKLSLLREERPSSLPWASPGAEALEVPPSLEMDGNDEEDLQLALALLESQIPQERHKKSGKREAAD